MQTQSVDLDLYEKQLKKRLFEALKLSNKEFITNNLDNEWSGHFFVYSEHLPLTEQNNDWACEWSYEVEGPRHFAKIYSKNGFDSTLKGNSDYFIAAHTRDYANMYCVS